MPPLRRSSRLRTKNAGTSKNVPKKPRPVHAKKDFQPPSRSRPQAGLLYLRVSRGFLNLLPAATAGQPVPHPLPSPGFLYVIRASLEDLHPFAGDTVDWLIRVARLIFEPLGTSSLFTFTADTLDSWLDRDMDPTQWRQVEQGEQLRATIYEFRPDNDAFITLSKMSLREGTSATTNTSQPRATAFRNAIHERDRKCIISQNPFSLAASHLLPKRLGDAGVTSVVQRFTGSDAAVTRFDPTIGVLLVLPLDDRVRSYEVGFWNSGPVSLLSFDLYHVNIQMAGPICHPQLFLRGSEHCWGTAANPP